MGVLSSVGDTKSRPQSGEIPVRIVSIMSSKKTKPFLSSREERDLIKTNFYVYRLCAHFRAGILNLFSPSVAKLNLGESGPVIIWWQNNWWTQKATHHERIYLSSQISRIWDLSSGAVCSWCYWEPDLDTDGKYWIFRNFRRKLSIFWKYYE